MSELCSIENSLYQDVLIIKLLRIFPNFIWYRKPQSVFCDAIFLIILVQIDGVTFKLYSHEADDAHTSTIKLLWVSNEPDERYVFYLLGFYSCAKERETESD